MNISNFAKCSVTLKSVLILAVLWGSAGMSAQEVFPLKDISQISGKFFIEMRYATKWNFAGRKIHSYLANKCFLSQETIDALIQVQTEVEQSGLSLLLFDCYRPQSAVNDFYQWSQNSRDQKMKSIFYPAEIKSQLFQRGYISTRSGHSRGSTVDLTLVKTQDAVGRYPRLGRLAFQETITDCRFGSIDNAAVAQLDMGTYYDCFSDLSATGSLFVSEIAQQNRAFLKSTMERFGFKNYSKEWWHFTLINESFPNTYFDHPVR